MFPFFTNPDGGQTINWFTEPTYGPTGLIYKTQYPNQDVTYRYWAQNLPPLVTSQFLGTGDSDQLAGFRRTWYQTGRNLNGNLTRRQIALGVVTCYGT